MKPVSSVSFSLLVLLATAIVSCTTPKENKSNALQRSSAWRHLLTQLRTIEPGYHYDLVSQDAENTYRTTKQDTAFFREYHAVVGYLSDTTRYVGIVYLEPGDDLYPSVKVFSKSGRILDDQTVCYAMCSAGGCEIDSCSSYIDVIAPNTIRCTLHLRTVPCNDNGEKNVDQASTTQKQRQAHISSAGKLVFSAEQVEDIGKN